MEKKYTVFISYRRDGGESTAKMLRDKLTELGYRVFFDVESLRSGDFNTKLYSVIDECSDFLLILSPGALERCRNEDDWVRLEIEHALSRGKNIIPVMLRGFSFPGELPESIEALRYKNGIESNYQFFDAFIEKLESFLIARPDRTVWIKKRGSKVGLLMFFLVAVLAVAGAVFAYSGRMGEKTYPGTDAEKNATGSLIYYVQNNLLQMEMAAEYLDQAYEACEQYLTHIDTSDRTALVASLQQNRRLLNQMDLNTAELGEELAAELQDSPFPSADVRAMHDYLIRFRESCVDNLYYMEYLTDPASYIDQDVREETLDSYREILAEELRTVAYGTNLLLLPVTNEEALKSFKHDFLPQLYYIPLQASDWSTDKDALTSAEDKSWNAINKMMDSITASVGEANMELMKSRAELIEKYMSEGASADEARSMAESLSGKSRLVTEQEAELQEMNKELDTLLDEARVKFAPEEGDDADTLWGKMLRFLSLKLYDEAVSCVEAYEEEVKDQDPYAQEYCPAAIAFIRNIENTGIDYGLIVNGYEPGVSEHPRYRIGDVIISVNGSPCHNYQEYSKIKETIPEEEDFRAEVLRASGDGSGSLETVALTIPAEAPRVALREMTEKDEW